MLDKCVNEVEENVKKINKINNRHELIRVTG